MLRYLNIASYLLFNVFLFDVALFNPSRQILFSRTPEDVLLQRSQYFPKDPIWLFRNVPVCYPGDVLIWLPGKLIQGVPKTFSGRPLEDLQSTKYWIFQKNNSTFLSELIRLTKSIYHHWRCIENPVKLLGLSIQMRN